MSSKKELFCQAKDIRSKLNPKSKAKKTLNTVLFLNKLNKTKVGQL